MTRLPQRGQPGLWPIVADLSDPMVERVLPYPMGEDAPTRSASSDSEPRTSLLCGVAMRADTTVDSGVTRTSAPTNPAATAIAMRMP